MPVTIRPTGLFHRAEYPLVCAAGHSYARHMPHAHAEVATPTPDRFIRQLVSHLSHKITAEWRSPGTAVIATDDGQCTLTAGSEVLVLDATADGAEGLAHIQDVVGRHLERFGARADLRVQWRHDGPAIKA